MARQRQDQIHEGRTVYDRDGDKIGTVEELLGSGAASSLRVSTGFLGLGHDLYVPTSAVARLDADGNIYLDADKDELEGMGWDAAPAGGHAEATGRRPTPC